MIKSYQKLRAPDENKTNDVMLEVNWSAKDDKSNECKLIRVTLGDKSAVIKKEHLLSMIFAMGTEEEQRKLIPQSITTSRWYESIISVTAKNDIKKGESITFPIKLSLPSVEEEVIGEIKK